MTGLRPALLPDWLPGDGGLQLSAARTCLSEEPLPLQCSDVCAGVDGWRRPETNVLRLSGHDVRMVGDDRSRPWRDWADVVVACRLLAARLPAALARRHISPLLWTALA